MVYFMNLFIILSSTSSLSFIWDPFLSSSYSSSDSSLSELPEECTLTLSEMFSPSGSSASNIIFLEYSLKLSETLCKNHFMCSSCSIFSWIRLGTSSRHVRASSKASYNSSAESTGLFFEALKGEMPFIKLWTFSILGNSVSKWL